MGFLRRGRNRSQSTVSASQHTSRRGDEDVISLLPGSDEIYLTRTKDGKPALGRKKNDRLLQDFGFDLLGQSFGVPSRREFETRSRPSRAPSQSSGLVTAPVTPQRGRRRQTADDKIGEDDDQIDDSLAVRLKASSPRSSSTPAPFTAREQNYEDASNLRRQAAHTLKSPPMAPQIIGQPTIYAPHPQSQLPTPPPPPSVVSWQSQPMMNTGLTPVPTSRNGSAYQSTHLPGYTPQGSPMFQGSPNGANSPYYITAQPSNFLVNHLPQAAAMPVQSPCQQLPQHQPQRIPHMQGAPGAHPVNFPPPPPPPPSREWLQEFAARTGHNKEPRRQAIHKLTTENIAKHRKQNTELTEDIVEKRDMSKRMEDMKKELSTRIQHVHACGGCGKLRSERYQKRHPLKRGEIPAPSYCYRCLKGAVERDCESSDEGSVENCSSNKYHREVIAPRFRTDKDDTYTNDKYMSKPTRHDSRGFRKPGAFKRPTSFISRGSSPSSIPQPPMIVSSTEQSRSRASSAASYLREQRYALSASRSQGRRQYGRTGDMSDHEIRDYRRRESDSVLTRETESENDKDEYEFLTTSKNKTGLARSHTHSLITSRTSTPTPTPTRRRVRRPKPQSIPASIDTTESTNSSCSTDIIDTKYNSPRSESNISSGAAHQAGVEVPRNSPKQTTPSQTRAAAKQADTQGVTKEAGKKGRVSPREPVEFVDAPDYAHYGNVQTSMNRPKNPTNTASEWISDEHAENSRDHSGLKSSFDEPQVPSNHTSGIGRDRTPPYEFPLFGESSLGGNASQAFSEPRPAFIWSEYMTHMDMDALHASTSRPRHVVNEPWSDTDAEIDRVVAEMAERDLASAGKIFDSYSGTIGGSSTAPYLSCFMRSNMSIVSYESVSDASDSDVPITDNQRAEATKTIEGVNATPVRQIEFSEQEEQRLESGILDPLTGPLTGAYPQNSGNSRVVLPEPGRILYDLSDEDGDAESIPSLVGSSLVGHTGHSAEDVMVRMPALEGVAPRSDP